METIQFIKQSGWTVAVGAIQMYDFLEKKHGFGHDVVNVGGANVRVSELRPLVDSWTFLANMYDSDLTKARSHLKYLNRVYRRNPAFPNLASRIKRVKKAISDINQIGCYLGSQNIHYL
ncbi:TPA: hypothetical protein ACJEU7_002571 [Acinetobacter baumannii]|uniref:hypothetical protein n=1 Tax=Acinetobacter baumannii TaxID=470 RepID=UPI00124A0B31|nr:hypothetical protein [Acinetobacter baumannii]KAB1665064.1 hypothetical protein F8B05_19325 [Acinetobacter baumannii]MCX3034088.1 hypothetical protein [Acinetobacter baumannii]